MRLSLLLLALVVIASSVTISPGQISPPLVNEDHFQTYKLFYNFQTYEVVKLRDQFDAYEVTNERLELLGNPAMKNEEPIIDGRRHHTWWAIDTGVSAVRKISVTHQFGNYELIVRAARFLVLPANKYLAIPDLPAPLPDANHYLCYDAVGDTLNIPVVIQDQFGTGSILIKQPRYFCNPVEKTLIDGTIFPILDYDAHLTCYDIETGMPAPQADILLQDQFHYTSNVAMEPCWFCIPSIKERVVGTEESTWGRIKALYSDR